jgi:hypothetical protein
MPAWCLQKAGGIVMVKRQRRHDPPVVLTPDRRDRRESAIVA